MGGTASRIDICRHDVELIAGPWLGRPHPAGGPRANARLADRICDSITKAVAALDFVFNGKNHGIGASVDIKTITGAAQSVSKLVSAADKTCYDAKSRRKGQWVSADSAAA
jgi:GGDEF domain-containing protein